MADAQRAQSILDFVLDLSQNPDKAAEYKADPAAYLTHQGFDADLQQEILQAQESALSSRSYEDDGGAGGTGGSGEGGGGTTVVIAVVVVVVV